ncbi:MAG TPA: ribosomal protein S18-alanine N-acetyltransferase [Bryobacteraceae bacterium]|jgi:ribosomal-protein-alanine N-acetyltransferase
MIRRYWIRPVAIADLDRIAEIEAASFGREAYDRKLFAHYAQSCRRLFLVITRRRKVVGYMITCIRGTKAAELVSVAVDPSKRQAGAASALLESTLRRLKRRGAASLRLVVRVTNTPAQAFYAKYGFRRVRVLPGYYEDGGDGIAMRRPVLDS